ncbi:MAG: thrombospondin type 3 repeat-containing protein [Lewinellaceae bacterium]|nr:thrombospondin type 3 repeat-containing protein [Lewinellaceae bacterium]
MKRLPLSIPLLFLILTGHAPAFGQSGALSAGDWQEIKGQALELVDYYAQLLNNICIEGLPETQRQKLIANAYDPDFPRAGFAGPEVKVEYDLTPSGFRLGSGMYQDASDYLLSFPLLYQPNGEMNSVKTTYLGCRTFQTSYPGVQVVFELQLNGVNKRGENFGTTQKIMETIAKFENGQWRVYIYGITHFSGSLDDYQCKNAFELDSDTDGVPDALDECPYEFGFRTISGCPDDDLDGVPNKYDPCPKVQGPKSSDGCPDSDNDGLPDHQDDCPYAAGPKELKGCPDSDGDGVLDKDDRCRFEPGLVALDGCPDSDGDEIPDIDDKCPEVPGVLLYRGCPEPDMDGDGVVDSMDECIDTPGLPRLKGCPDQDGDGIPDKYDRCIDVKGPARFKGCPDSDGDTIPDLDDTCPGMKGKVENCGCPWWMGSKGFVANMYIAGNYQLASLVDQHSRSIGPPNFGRRLDNFGSRLKEDFRFQSMEHFGVTVYAPIGGYFFGYHRSPKLEPFPIYTVYQLSAICTDLESKGVDVQKPNFYDTEYAGRFFHAGLCVGPFYRIKYLRHLFFTAGLTFMDGATWEEYRGDLNGIIPASYDVNKFAVNFQQFNQETHLEAGIALVFPFAHTEFTYYGYNNSWSWKAGVNVPLSFFIKNK